MSKAIEKSDEIPWTCNYIEKIISSRKLKKHQILKHVENAKTFEKVMLEHVLALVQVE